MRRASNCMASLLLLSAALLPATLDGAVCKSEYKNAPGGLVHTACKPPNRRCKITSSGLSSSKKTEFLKAHNDYRMKVAKGDLPNFPKAADMQKLIWDDELAEVAQALADQCTVSNGGIKHDKYDERFTVKFKQVGQNLGWAAASFDDPDVDVIGQVTRWFNEYQYFNPAGIHSLRHQSGPAVGHFTQVIWAATEAVGCGMARYTLQDDRSGTPYQKLYVCNYGPG
ncbi:antigen 5/SCP domain-containing protein, putative [Ixodes scapularis]|uniref:Antigen 5/SCP domain-containing protein, putative n=1 Tax=Ixodes scapularis TaxID=6945 RepID=B7PHU0_IXOSC|nr:antigen 5/SCP domain-containing protein, putative [Ixodes scapularis]|eukprot:XP_002403519.1 antigen 5/SCP domain-containing protein, putative [Ixodes scapularis]